MLLVNLLLIFPSVGIFLATALLAAGFEAVVASPSSLFMIISTLVCSIAALVELLELVESKRANPDLNIVSWDALALPLMLSVASFALTCLLIALVASPIISDALHISG